ncbi:hypothetical protein GGR88_001311 [Sphingomonas jejuensis]|uniref:Trypsin n=1 Tax=Sphingomonas jejuensis TaxID=904715 RepID=A0ABX0XKF3_9SPHN|nr:hypothetical protein [Sphingomonas jejuensis]NJC33837.1 hypothetical protein [Sphingomonas jejuensis]
MTVWASAAGAQGAASAPLFTVQPPDAALRQDAEAVALHLGITAEQAERQLWLQQASVPLTEAIARRFADRLTGISVEHRPGFRIVVRLTGDAPVPAEQVDLAGMRVDVVYVVGNPASHAAMVQAISTHQAAIRASLAVPPGLGIDQRTGELVAVVARRDVAREGAEPLRVRLSSLTGVPVRLRVVDRSELDMSGEDTGESGVVGGMRMLGANPGDPRQYLCTAGFVVSDGVRLALTTAAHCPDVLRVRDAAGRERTLPFVGQWGWGHQDVQVNLAETPLPPRFLADTARLISRDVTGAQPRASTRGGDMICHRGERTGYSCSQIELTDFAPAGDLCAGACLPTWITVAGPRCRGGDSGGPVFLGTTAHGIVKGGSYRADGSCAFYFYMSTDYLPEGWTLLTAPSETVPAQLHTVVAGASIPDRDAAAIVPGSR